MTQDETIEFARQAGINYRELSDEFATGNGDGVEIEQMEAFAKLIAAKEREACAKHLDNQNTTITDILAAEIRARGQA